MKVYLCGGINSLSDAQAKNWREEAKTVLAECEILDPMRRDYRGIEDQSVDAIVRGDLADIVECNIVLVNATRPSWGTAMEIVYARTMKRYIIAFVEPNKPISPWLHYHCDVICTSLAKALEEVTQ